MTPLDQNQPLEFIGGGQAFIVAIISSSGSCYRPTLHTQDYADAYAELYEQGVRYMVATDRMAKTGGCVDLYGTPVRPWDDQFFATVKPVQNRIAIADTAGMELNEMWGMF